MAETAEQHAILRELLPAHRVPAAADADDLALGRRGEDRRARVGGGAYVDDAIDDRRVELRVDVVDRDARARRKWRVHPFPPPRFAVGMRRGIEGRRPLPDASNARYAGRRTILARR
jgi:hypothetical protein